MRIFGNGASSLFGLFLALWLTADTGLCAKSESKLVTRIETVTTTLKHQKLVMHVSAMAHTGGTLLPKGGMLVRRSQDFQPNKEGLLEYELRFTPPRGEPGDKLYRVKAALTEHSIPVGIKGVRVFAEFNHMDSIFPEEKKKK